MQNTCSGASGREGPPTLTVADGIATITLRRPARRNALVDEDLYCLLGHFAQADADPAVRVLVLVADTGDQVRPIFCSGYSVEGFDGAGHDPMLFEKVADALERLRPLTLCALNGSVFGGATDLVLACDLCLGMRGTQWRMPAVAMGLHYYPGGLRRYVSRLGLNFSKKAFLAAQRIDCEELAATGFFVQMAPPHEFGSVLAAFVQDLAGMAPLAAQATKQSLNEIAAGQFEEQRLRLREQTSLQSHDFVEGRAALAQRRPPRFLGH